MMTTGILLLTVLDVCMEKMNKQEWFTVSSHKKLYNSPANMKTELPSICIAEGFVKEHTVHTMRKMTALNPSKQIWLHQLANLFFLSKNYSGVLSLRPN